MKNLHKIFLDNKIQNFSFSSPSPEQGFQGFDVGDGVAEDLNFGQTMTAAAAAAAAASAAAPRGAAVAVVRGGGVRRVRGVRVGCVVVVVAAAEVDDGGGGLAAERLERLVHLKEG